MSYSYWNSNLFSGSGYDVGIDCFPKTTLEMQAESFVTLLNANKGAYSSWVAVSGDYPTFGNPIPSVTLSVNNLSIAEEAGVATVTAMLSATTTETVTMILGFSGTAMGGGTDYTVSSSTITIAPGNLTGIATVTAVQDALDEVNETVIIDITSVTNGTESGTQQATVTITDDDAEPSLSVNDPSVTEGNSGIKTLTFTVTLSAASGRTVTVDYYTANGTATAGTDYNATSGALTFNPGETSKTVSVIANGDTVTEPDETLLLNLLNPGNATISDAQGFGTILDNDAPLVTLNVNKLTIAEEAEVVTVTAALSTATTEIVTVTLGFSGTAMGGGTDYTASSSTITIAPGNLTGTATITAVQDALDEVNETVIIDITDVTNAVESGTQQVTVTITDDDAQPSLSVNNTSVNEGYSGTTTMTFTITLSVPSGRIVTVNYTTLDGTATSAEDYTSVNGMLTFTPGQTSKTVNVLVIGDDSIEAHETVLLNLAGSINATISNAQGNGIIYDDDTSEPEDTPPENNAVVEVNGEKQDAGQVSTDTVDDKTVTTITIDDEKLNGILDTKGNDATVTLPVKTNTDVVIGQLNGQTIKNMENMTAILEIKTENVTYTLPASQINIDSISSEFGPQTALDDIKVSIKISEPSADTVKVVSDIANEGGYQLVVQPIDFEITCTYNEETVEVTNFSGYVERTIAIPDGIDPAKITTGIVLNSDGTFRHVPTEIIVIDGKYYAKINSLTNSTYSVIYNNAEFSDISNHWAEDAIKDMASRMVVEGNEDGRYNPNNYMTRADFAMVIINALGLEKSAGESIYTDVKTTDWFFGYVKTATAYALINGYDGNHYGPNDFITREQVMTIISRAMKLTGLNSELTDVEVNKILAGFSDKTNVSAYAAENVAACIKAGIINGTSFDTLSPKSYTTRAEAAVMIQRLLRNSGLINVE